MSSVHDDGSREADFSFDRVYCPPFDHSKVVEGNSTIVKEILEQLAEQGASPLASIVASVGGGGLLAGILQGLSASGAEGQSNHLATQRRAAEDLCSPRPRLRNVGRSILAARDSRVVRHLATGRQGRALGRNHEHRLVTGRHCSISTGHRPRRFTSRRRCIGRDGGRTNAGRGARVHRYAWPSDPQTPSERALTRQYYR